MRINRFRDILTSLAGAVYKGCDGRGLLLRGRRSQGKQVKVEVPY